MVSRMLSITTSRHAYQHLLHLGRLEVEEFWILALHANKRLITSECVFRGTVDACPVYPRDVFRAACRTNAANLIIAHNHPSGDTNPSREDILITKKLVEAGRLLGIPLVDHLVIAKKNFWSFADHGFEF